ncbi:MAG TPA: EAL domain-containing protein, partial [Thermoanaerobaculia bacterium]|nr:EAL domain-containing protein [Thermoanaerobaculia bacterium]
LRELRDFGFALWLDDFGTGHSSLEHLQLFPLDGLKVPKNFMSESGRPIARAIIALACELGLQSIAEGVETPEQLEFLRDLHCDYVQGFLFSRPLTPEQFRGGLPDSTRRGGDRDRA